MLWLLNIIAYIINAVFVGGGGSLGFFGEDIGTVSDRYPTFVTPADYAFSIWGLIFAAELVFVLWGAFGSNRNSPILTKGVSVFFIIACISQAAWIVAFLQESLVLSAVLLLVIAGSLATIVIRLACFKLEEHGLFFTIPFWTVHFPIGLHGGWTLAASLVNITVALETDSVSTETAALILATVTAAVAASLASLVFYDPVYLAAIVWAIAAIAANEDYRIERLEEHVADGMTEGLEAVWIMLVCVAVVGTIAFGVRKAKSDKHAAEQNFPQRHRATSGTARHAATLAVVLS